MIKTYEQYNELDPYGEEEWEINYNIGDLVKCKKNFNNKLNDGAYIFKEGEYYEIVNTGYTEATDVYDSYYWISLKTNNYYIRHINKRINAYAFKEKKFKEYFE